MKQRETLEREKGQYAAKLEQLDTQVMGEGGKVGEMNEGGKRGGMEGRGEERNVLCFVF